MNKELLDKWLVGRKHYYDADMLLRFNKDMDKINVIKDLMSNYKDDPNMLKEKLLEMDPAAIKRYIDYTENKIYCVSETIVDLLKKFYSQEKPLYADNMIHQLTDKFNDMNNDLKTLISVLDK